MTEQNIKKEDYVLFYKTSTTPFYPGCNVALAHSREFNELLKEKCSPFEVVFVAKKNVSNWFYNTELRDTAEKFKTIIFKKEFVKLVEKKRLNLEIQFNELLKFQVSELFDNNMLNEKGIDIFNKLNNLFMLYSEIADLPLFMCQMFFENQFNKELLSEISGTKEEKQTRFNILISTSYETNYEKYLKDILSAINNEISIKEIAEKYYWLIYDYLGKVIDEKYVLEELKKYTENVEEFKQKIDSISLRINNFNKELNNCSEKLKEKILAYQKLNWLYNERKKFIIPKASIFLKNLFEYKFKEITFSQLKKLFMLTPNELINVLKLNMSLLDILSKIPENLQYLLYDGKISKLNSKYQKLIEMNETLEFVKGTTAYPGKIKGRAKIILNQSQMNTFNSDEILVAPFTNVNYLQMMHKAKAILTETGGLTSHAAIVSRELKKPCVVGIKHLIDFLNNDDLIEIDADSGTIRKIENSQN